MPRRLIDFASGLSQGLYGKIERVTNKVFLLSPEHVAVSGEQAEAESDVEAGVLRSLAARRVGVGDPVRSIAVRRGSLPRSSRSSSSCGCAWSSTGCACFVRGWRPRGAALVAGGGGYTVTDPPIQVVRRIIPPIRMGGVRVEFSWSIVMLVCLVLIWGLGSWPDALGRSRSPRVLWDSHPGTLTLKVSRNLHVNLRAIARR